LHGFAVTPVCSTVLELKPSIPTQNDAKAFLALQETVGITNDPLTSVTDPALELFTAYPAQFRLPTVLITLETDGRNVVWIGELER